MPAVQFVVEGGKSLKGSIRPSGNKNAALPIVAAALLSPNPVHLENVPRIRDIETLVELKPYVPMKVTGKHNMQNISAAEEPLNRIRVTNLRSYRRASSLE